VTAIALEAVNLEKRFESRRRFGRTSGQPPAVDNVSFSVDKGSTLALVGESGSGKTTTLLMLALLLPPSAGEIRYDGEDALALDRSELRRLRRNVQVVFQDPYASLDPHMTVERLVREPLDVHREGARADRLARVRDALERVALSPGVLGKHAHELSGGQAQRVAIARAIVLDPAVLLLDEPTSALDVSVQAQVVTLLSELQRELGLTYVFVTHNLGIVAAIADAVAVMEHGRIVERGDPNDVLSRPSHPYTKELLASVLSPNGPRLEASPVLIDERRTA
jgi:ABC-type glutathione transport system ATPase component